MQKNILTVIGIVILFLSLSINPSAAIFNVKESSRDFSDKTVIIVDDEGDGDYIRISDALSNATPGDIIEVYSGIYYEEEIVMTTENITLRGIPYELGAGNDFGKPVINDITKPYDFIIIKNSNITIDGFIVDSHQGSFLNDTVDIFGDNNVISNCDIIGNGLGFCIVTHYANNIRIINNNLSDGNSGVFLRGSNTSVIGNRIYNNWRAGIRFTSAKNCNISGNLINDSESGIEITSLSGVPKSSNIKINNNIITSCGVGIIIDDKFTLTFIEKNEFKDNEIGIKTVDYRYDRRFCHNNFIKNKKDVIIHIDKWFPTFFTWCENYWDTWNRIGPKRIVNIKLIPIIYPPIILFIPILKVVAYDLHPAQEPYDIRV